MQNHFASKYFFGITVFFMSIIYLGNKVDIASLFEIHNKVLEYIKKTVYIPYLKILFCCVEDEFSGGESPLSFNRDILRDLDPKVSEKLKTKKIKYVRNMLDKKHSDYLTWQHTFETDDVKKAEEDMRNQNMEWEWMENGDLSTYNFCEAFREHPTTKEMVFFNQATGHHSTTYLPHPKFEGKCLTPRQYPWHSLYGDGEEFEEVMLEHLREIHWKNAIPLRLEKGDILFMDNYLCAHARMAFEGKRKFLVSLIE